MDLTIAGRMGGPEVGAFVHAELVSMRQALKASFADLEVPGVDRIELTLFFNGSVTVYADRSGITDVAYRPAARSASASLTFAAEEVAGVQRTDLRGVMQRRLLDAADAIVAALARRGLDAHSEPVRSAVDQAFRRRGESS